MSKLAKALTAAAGNAGESLYVEDVFSTYLYDGNGSTQTITNGIDLDGEGGLVWGKSRSDASIPFLTDTERGTNSQLATDRTNLAYTQTNAITSFNSDGFTLGSNANLNGSGRTQVAWTFRKAEKFFDVVTYTGNGVAGRAISHNLGTTPSFILVKSTNSSQWWAAYHTSLGADYHFRFNENFAAFQSLGYIWGNGAGGSVEPTDTDFTVYNDSAVNGTGKEYVAYLFASDAGGFGDDGSESIIKCGSYTGNSAGVEVDLGFEPQWVLVKPSSTTGNWDMADIMRGATAEKTATFDGNWAELTANTSTAEIARDATITPRATGMFIKDNGLSNNGATYIYIAIRRPMKTPESGTEVFNVIARSGTGSSPTVVDNGFTADMVLYREREEGYDPFGFRIQDRFRGQNFIETFSTDAEANFISDNPFNDKQNSIVWNTSGYHVNDVQGTYVFNSFKRATGFFDVVAYTGDSVSGRTVTHNLKVIPELIICKARAASWDWVVYTAPTGGGYYLKLNDTQSSAASSGVFPSAPTDSVFSLGSGSFVNSASAGPYIAYLFATVAGVSKVGSYTGTGSNVNVDCGFSAGARFILIKRTDSTGDWYVYDYFRGIVSGNDPYLLLNTGTGEVTSTDYIDPLSSGFTVTSSAPAALNASGGTYIFMAIS